MGKSEELLRVAAGELGTRESPAGSNNVKYNTWYYGRAVSGAAYPWCMAFVQWCCDRAGLRLPYLTASCSALLNWFRQNRPGQVVTDPEPGDIIIYNFGHTGIVEAVGQGVITAIEGNTSAGSSGSQANGGGVYRRKRKTSLVTAYIRPQAAEEINTEEDDMDQDKFNQMFRTALGEYRKELRDNDSGEWSEEARRFAVEQGIFVGSGTAPDGQPNYMWEDLLTREQAAVLLYRFAQKCGMA